MDNLYKHYDTLQVLVYTRLDTHEDSKHPCQTKLSDFLSKTLKESIVIETRNSYVNQSEI